MNILYHHRTRAEDVEGVHIRGMVHALRDAGHAVDVLSPPGVDPEAGGAVRHGGAAATKKVRARAPGSPWSLLSRHAPESVFEAAEVGYNGYALPRIAARLRRLEYGMLYERYALFSIAGAIAARQRGVPHPRGE